MSELNYDDLEKFLLENNWKNFPTLSPSWPEVRKELWVKKNGDLPSFVLDFVSMEIHDGVAHFVNVDITGESSDIWFRLDAYSLSIEDFVNKHETIEATLTRAWRAL